MKNKSVTASLRPSGQLGILSRAEINQLLDVGNGGLYELFRTCALAVLNCGNDTDNAKQLLEDYATFNIEIIHEGRGIKLYLKEAPDSAFVDGRIIAGISELLFAVLRDILYVHTEFSNNRNFDLNSSSGITDAVFHILRNANITAPVRRLKTIVCWGGHSIDRDEYDYTKEVGYQLGLRGFDICTGCGPGAMKGPMKGAAVGHTKQRIVDGRYLGISEPGIIAAEAPNPMVNNLVIMPDIEKRLEAFVRVGHGIIVFPGGVGTTEELLYLLGILMHESNAAVPFPVVLSGPEQSADYFVRVDRFIRNTLGNDTAKHYEVIIDDAVAVARHLNKRVKSVHRYRIETSDAHYFNWELKIPGAFQTPFEPTHENIAALNLGREQPLSDLAANLRRVFSAIVAGNVKEQGIRQVDEFGPFELHGDPEIMHNVDELLTSFVDEGRMKLPGTAYTPCYVVNRS